MNETTSDTAHRMPEPPATLVVHGGIVIPVLDAGDSRTVGLMVYAGKQRGLDEVVVCMTPEQARHIAAELIEYANR